MYSFGVNVILTIVLKYARVLTTRPSLILYVQIYLFVHFRPLCGLSAELIFKVSKPSYSADNLEFTVF